MPVLTVALEDGEQRIPFNCGCSMRDILDETDMRVRSGCSGLGRCGLCRVRIERGEPGTLTPNERLILDSHELEQGVRLACQVIPRHDIKITILAPARKSCWKSYSDKSAGRVPSLSMEKLPEEVISPYGVAVDVGTTNITVSLYDLTNGRCLAGRYGQNPQSCYGSDVVTRLIAAANSAEQAQAMSQLVTGAIGDALFDIAVREGIGIEKVVRLTLVGNTAMLALLSGRNYNLLLQPANWMSSIDCLPDNADAWGSSLGIHPGAHMEIMPPLAGFVGSDLLAGVLATRLTERKGGSLFIDFGTNSEIALWDGRTLHVTSAAGGPAFEGSGISCGFLAEPGAIWRVNARNGVFDYSVIGEREPLGLCGSGIVDLIACLIRSGGLTSKGAFAPPLSEEGFAIRQGNQGIVLTKRDVDVFQRAKAAIATGIEILLGEAAMGSDDLNRICVGGVFGSFLDTANAARIGLLPGIPPERVELCRNTALAGCADALLSDAAAERLRNLGHLARLINMSRCPDFDNIFMRNLFLLPMGVN
jgi:uncharacterized 2Fe-2S/4Fe-4S cluster protein (DUF4445 family)